MLPAKPAKIGSLCIALFCVMAMSRPGHSAPKDACADDTKRFCAKVKPGGGRIVECLKAHTVELSRDCKAILVKGRHPCSEDNKKFCAGVKPGEGRIFNCLKPHEAELTPACREYHNQQKERMKKSKPQGSKTQDKPKTAR